MRTILTGVVAVGLWYAVQAALLTRWLGWQAAVLWIIVAYLAAQVDLRLDDRLVRAARRARTYLALRRNAELRASISTEMDALVEEARKLEQALQHSARSGRPVD
jgi:hypothetical protein